MRFSVYTTHLRTGSMTGAVEFWPSRLLFLVQYVSTPKAKFLENGLNSINNNWFPESAIEIGCGYGATTLWLAKQGLRRCIGLDIVEAPLEKGTFAIAPGLNRI